MVFGHALLYRRLLLLLFRDHTLVELDAPVVNVRRDLLRGALGVNR